MRSSSSRSKSERGWAPHAVTMEPRTAAVKARAPPTPTLHHTHHTHHTHAPPPTTPTSTTHHTNQHPPHPYTTTLQSRRLEGSTALAAHHTYCYLFTQPATTLKKARRTSLLRRQPECKRTPPHTSGAAGRRCASPTPHRTLKHTPACRTHLPYRRPAAPSQTRCWTAGAPAAAAAPPGPGPRPGPQAGRARGSDVAARGVRVCVCVCARVHAFTWLRPRCVHSLVLVLL